jgi:predicted phage baseplate assembly protein
LKKAPLTYVSADTTSGSKSTLEVRVNDILWEEKTSLYGLDANQRAHIVRISDEAKATVIFGDGKEGSRVPTGSSNVIATYRSGIGLEGQVEADTLTLLQSRPPGIRAVTNPVEAGGAEDPDTLDEARTAGPTTVRTLDRIVSLDDYTDFASAYAGVGKALATSIEDGALRLIVVTIASASGDPVSETDALHENLTDSIESYRAPLLPFLVTSFVSRFFNVVAALVVDEAYLFDEVSLDVQEALIDTFSFERRTFGQAVSAAEVITTIQDVEGVVAVDLE